MAVNLGGTRGLKNEINVTPFVDVALVLLIIFMVVTPLLQRGKSVDLPKARHAVQNKAPGPDPLFISVTKDGGAYIESDKTPATPERVTPCSQP